MNERELSLKKNIFSISNYAPLKYLAVNFVVFLNLQI